ncbi:uncharacterized protein LOC133189047 isoform X1 [Saccostrea echinata]|uniref:uncharacterized protein LOC133189047 isoform X1 n=1 Tax=Saccostrea echinata TaxID=191078 RepID=UPI002A82102D|nr:uncharacterized protein LOC133189047 isoform X1 [Saccostrea echinata]
MAFKIESVVMLLLVILLVNNPGLLTVKGGDSRCWSMNGRCQYTYEPCFQYKPGYCAGATNRQCCVRGADVQCWRARGTCQNKSNFCSGRYLRGLCGGGLSRQCCV